MSNNVENWLVSIFQPDYMCFGCASLFNRSPNWNFFHLIFCSIFAINSTSGCLFLNKYLIVFGGLGYIVFIHKKFCCAQLQIFSQFEKNILVTVKNWWSLTYGQVYISWLCLHVRCIFRKWLRNRCVTFCNVHGTFHNNTLFVDFEIHQIYLQFETYI